MKHKFNHLSRSVIVGFLILMSAGTQAQERELSNLSFGFQLQQIQNDFGFGVHLLSPSFGAFRVKTSYNYSWFIHENTEQASVWTEYSNFNFGTRYQNLVSNNVNLYFELGSQLILNQEDVSSEKMNFGAYGLFGFEFFLTDESVGNMSYFFELGATGNNSRADMTISRPKIANGFTTSVGFRF